MNCPLCGASTKVIDTRGSGVERWRRRECKSCGHRFTTYEIPAGELEELRDARRVVIDAMLVTLDEVLARLREEGK